MPDAPLPASAAPAGPAPLHPLVQRLVEVHRYPYAASIEALAGELRDVLLFLPVHGKAHLETPDIAAVLPELVKALDAGRGHLTGAVAGPAAEAALREALSLALPAIVVLRGGTPVGSVARMRDWDEYLARLGAVLAVPAASH